WKVTGVNNGQHAVVTTTQTEQLTAEFHTDGAFSAFGGCNQLSGTYTTTGTSGLTFGPLTTSNKTSGDAVDQIETEYSTALGQVATYVIAANTLTMQDAQGGTEVTAVLGQ